ncbi:hypothetical protein ACH5RR_022197 [Cinchona calisaya]|uniref:Filament-like plant protein 7 n=1 Tax=Cinchona calisaya TaxID=153742 RepID=A0ABD2ZAI4_9GENT
MDQKTWIWRKRSSEKTIIASGKADFDFKGKEKVQVLPNEKEVALEESVKILNEKLASLTSEYTAKEEQLQNHAKLAQEAMAGQEKAEAELLHLKKELDEALQQKLAANDRLGNLNVALKDCMLQLNSAREEQEQRVNDTIMRTSKEFDKAHKRLEEKLSETSKKLANLTLENAHLNKAIQLKESLIEDLSNRRSQVEAEFDALMARLDSVEKENAFLRYEFRELEKDLDIRNEEIEFTRHSADTSQKHYLESMNKVKKLETECQRLRVLVRKRLPAPALLANMKAEIEIQGKCQIETRRRKSNPVTGGLVVKESTRENLDISSKRINFLVERLQNVEQENKILRDLLAKKDNDLSHSVAACTQIVPISSQNETQLGEPRKAQQSFELSMSNTVLTEISSQSDIHLHDEHETNSSRSWTSALVSGPENIKDGELKHMPEHKMLGISDMSLMDDFVEMEKLAIVSVDVPHESFHASTGMELVPVGQELSERHQQLQTSDLSSTKPCDWLQAVLKVILEELRVSERSIDEILEDIKIALQNETYEVMSSTQSRQSELLPISGYITWKSPTTSPTVGSSKGVRDILEESNHEAIRSISKSIGNIIELVRRLNSGHSGDCIEPDNWLETDSGTSPPNQLTTAEDFAIHVFGWKSCELATVLQQFLDTCKSLVDGKTSFDTFVAELSTALECVMKNCITNQAISGSRYDLRHHFSHDAKRTATELGSVQNLLLEMEKIHSILQVENKGLKTELNLLKSLKKDLELNLQYATDKSEALTTDLEQSQKSINSLQSELEKVSESKRMIDEQFENQKLINEELDTQLTVTKVRLNDASQKLSSLEVELEDKNHYCEELEGRCLELQLQLESKEILKDDINQEEKLLQTGWEIKAASVKLAECEASILNLGNQLKALNSPKEASYVNKMLANPTKNNKKLNRRFSLLDRMLSEDTNKMEDLKPSQAKELISTAEAQWQHPVKTNSGREFYVSSAQLAASDKNSRAGALVVVSSKKRGRGTSFVRRLLLWRKRGSSKKTPFPFTM